MPDRNSASINTTPYNEEELEHFKELLLKEQKDTFAEIEELKENIDGIDDNRDDTVSSQDHHVGDLGTEEERKETNYTLIDRNLDKIDEIKAALDRIDNGTYGVCAESGVKIHKERLEAIPYAKYSVGIKNMHDNDNPGPIGS